MDLTDGFVRELASSLGGPITIESVDGELLAFSPHDGLADPLRQLSILTQEAVPPELGLAVRRWLARFPLVDGSITHVPGNVELGILPRVAVPVEGEEGLRGVVWVLMPTDGSWEGLAPRARALLDDLGSALGAGGRRHDDAVGTLEDLFSPLDAVSAAAARRLAVQHGWSRELGMAVLVLRPSPGWTIDLEAALQTGLRVADLTLGLHPAFGITRDDEAILVVPAAATTQAALAGALADAWVGALPDTVGRHVRIGIAGWQPDLAHLRAGRDQARIAADLADQDRPLQRWDRLGVLALAGALPTRVASSLVSPRVHRLLEQDPDGVLRRTVETYLDMAGRGTAAAERLRLHRTTLYYRLQRVQELTGVDLQDGQDRLELHLGLKFSHLVERAPT